MAVVCDNRLTPPFFNYNAQTPADAHARRTFYAMSNRVPGVSLRVGAVPRRRRSIRHRLKMLPTIVVPSDEELLNARFYLKRVWRPAVREALFIGGCRWWLDALTLIYDLDGKMRFSDGTPYRPGDVDDLFPPHAPERWFARFLERAPDGNEPVRIFCCTDRLRPIKVYCDAAERLRRGD